MLKPEFFNDRRLWLLALNGLTALLVGFVLIPGETALMLFNYGGYWFIMGTTVWLGWALCRVIRRAWSPDEFTRVDAWCFLGIVAGWGLWLVHEPTGFKIIMDEIMILGASMSMHFDQLVQVPYRGHNIQGAFVIVEGVVDKRPIFFPFLLSVVHAVAGYRPANVFWLNGALGLVFLNLLYLIGRSLAGRLAAMAVVTLMVGLPLLAQNARGGGFELLNIVMILLVLWLAMRLLQTRAGPELGALCLATVCLAQTRYESAIFVLPVGGLILWFWWQERRPVLAWPLIWMPILLLPVPLLQKVFTLRESSWQMFSKPGVESPFGVNYVFENLAHAWSYFFAWGGVQPNSWALSFVGCGALVFMLMKLISWRRRPEPAQNSELATWFVVGGLVALTGLLMSYFWGKFDDPIITRLSLPVQVLMVLAILLVIPDFPRAKRVTQGLLAIALAQLWFVSVPAMSTHAYTLNYVHGLEVEWRREFIKKHPEKDYLVIDPNSIVWITNQISSTPPLQAKLKLDAIRYNYRNRLFSEFYVFQHFEVNETDGSLTLEPDYDVGPAFTLETVQERRLSPLTLARISRIVAIDPEAVSLNESGQSAPVLDVTPFGIGRESIDEETPQQRARREYWAEWLRNLP